MDIVFTLDYELFLDDMTGTVKNSLIRPMQEVQKICEKHNFRFTIFVDAAYLHRLYELKEYYPSLEEDYKDTVNNIKWLVDLGHDIQLHIHPQWYYSNYDGKEWTLDWDHYKLSDMPRDYAFEMFGKSKDLLDSIIGYKTTLFRAGGFSIQDFDYENCFKQHGIIGDSSVLPGCKMKHKTHSYDYKKSKARIYKFTKNIDSAQSDGIFWEFPISTAGPVNIIRYLSVKESWMAKTENRWGDGGNRPHNSLMSKIKSIISSFEFIKYPYGSIDHQCYFWLEDVYKYSKKYDCMTVIGHPKNFSPSGFPYLERFIIEKQSKGDNILTLTDYIKKRSK